MKENILQISLLKLKQLKVEKLNKIEKLLNLKVIYSPLVLQMINISKNIKL